VFVHGQRNASSDIWSLGCVFVEMFSVLKGSNADALRTFLRPPPGSDSNDPRPDRVEEWLNTLREQGDARDNCIIKWVSAMLEPRPEMRATATMLHDDIAKETEDSDLAFCGQCCMPENEVSEVEDEPDYEDGALNENPFIVDGDLQNKPRHRTCSAGHSDLLKEQERWEQLENERRMLRYRDRNHFGQTQERVRARVDRLAIPVYEEGPRRRRVSEEKGGDLVEEDPEWLDSKVDRKEGKSHTQDDLQRWKDKMKAKDAHATEGNAGQESKMKHQGGEQSGIRYDTWEENDNGKEYDTGYDKWQE
jgi:serine/threonine protein kinase